MVTVVTKTIGTGGGRDYSTLQSWEDAAPANLVTSDQVWRGECYNDAEFTAALTVSGSTVDATRYKELTVASGQAFADHANKLTNALRYNASNGAALRSTTAWSSALTVSENYFRLSRLQIYQDSSNGYALTINNQGAVVDGVIVETRGGRALLLLSNSTATNSLFVSRKSSVSEVASIWDGCAVKNCVFAVPSDLTAATSVIRRLYWSGNTFTNCAFFGGTDAVSSATGATFSNCYTNDSTSIPSGCTTVAYDTSTGSGFENITSGTHDYRIKSTSALKDAGTSTGAPSVDIVGTARPSGSDYDVGCWEYASGGGDVTVSLSGSQSSSGAGSLGPASSVSVSGSSVSSSAGSITAALSVSVSGASAASAAGTLAPSLSVALSGASASASAGTVSTGNDVAVSLSGQQATTAAGSLGVAVQVALSGASTAAAAGAVVPGISLSLSGSAATAYAGTITPSVNNDVVVGLSGSESIADAGIVVASGGTAATRSAGFEMVGHKPSRRLWTERG